MHKGTVLQTGPDELFFDKEFRKIEISDGKLTITNFLDKKNFEYLMSRKEHTKKNTFHQLIISNL